MRGRRLGYMALVIMCCSSAALGQVVQHAEKAEMVISAAKQTPAGGRKPVSIHFISSDAEREILARLDDETAFSFQEVSLSEAMAALSTQHNIPIVIDTRALEEIRLDAATGVSLSLKGVSLRSGLRLLLRDLDLAYLIKDEVLQITTRPAAEDNLMLEMYSLPPQLADKADKISSVIQKAVVPDTWEVLGGNSCLTSIDHVLVVSSTEDVHHQVRQFLTKLIAQYGN